MLGIFRIMGEGKWIPVVEPPVFCGDRPPLRRPSAGVGEVEREATLEPGREYKRTGSYLVVAGAFDGLGWEGMYLSSVGTWGHAVGILAEAWRPLYRRATRRGCRVDGWCNGCGRMQVQEVAVKTMVEMGEKKEGS